MRNIRSEIRKILSEDKPSRFGMTSGNAERLMLMQLKSLAEKWKERYNSGGYDEFSGTYDRGVNDARRDFVIDLEELIRSFE